MKYRMRTPEGQEYTLECNPAVLLEKRVQGDGPLRIGETFRRLSKLDGTIIHDTLVGLVVTVPLGVLSTWCRGFRSDAMGINPVQRLDALREDARLGIGGVDYDEKTGQAIFSSPGVYKRYCEAHGFYDRNGGYGSPQKRDPREREIRGLPQMAESGLGELA